MQANVLIQPSGTLVAPTSQPRSDGGNDGYYEEVERPQALVSEPAEEYDMPTYDRTARPARPPAGAYTAVGAQQAYSGTPQAVESTM